MSQRLCFTELSADEWVSSRANWARLLRFPGTITYVEQRPRSVFVTCRQKSRVLSYEVTKRRSHMQKRFLHSWPLEETK